MNNENKFKTLAQVVRYCGNLAKERQLNIKRNFKDDGSILTEVDLLISKIIKEEVIKLFPNDNFISEEFEIDSYNKDAEYTFILDPIDGTDVFSQGLPTFAIALGVLDKNRNPIGAYISAPRFGYCKEELFIQLDPGGKLLIDDKEFTISTNKDFVDQITLGSHGYLNMDFSRFNGKIRCFGSSILHLLAIVIFPNFQACINQPCYVWDIASAHAVLKKVNMDIEYVDGSKFEYTDDFLLNKKPFKIDFYAGTDKGIKMIKELIPFKH